MIRLVCWSGNGGVPGESVYCGSMLRCMLLLGVIWGMDLLQRGVDGNCRVEREHAALYDANRIATTEINELHICHVE